MIKVQIIGMLGAMLLGFGLLCYFSDTGSAVDALAKPWLVYGSIGLGSLLLAIEIKLLLSIIKDRASKLRQDHDD